jgi:MFS family permease
LTCLCHWWIMGILAIFYMGIVLIMQTNHPSSLCQGSIVSRDKSWLMACRPWIVWGLGAAFFLFEYVVRVSPSVMAPWLMDDFHTNALGVGTLAVLFYYPYIGMQLPVGALVDRFGSHKLLVFTTFLCALGCVLFAKAPNLYVAGMARVFLGFGAAFAFVGTLKLVTVWFPIRRFALLAGYTQALGMLGAAVGEAPMSFMVREMGWQYATLVCAAVFAVLSVLIAVLVRDKPEAGAGNQVLQEPVKSASILQGLKIVLARRDMWLNAGFAGFLYASSAAFAELWGVTYLQNAFALTHQQAANAVIMIFIGWGVGGPLMGWLVGHLRRRRPMRLFSAISGGVIMTLILYGTGYSYAMVLVLLFLYGLTNAGLMLAYATAGEIEPREIAGTSIAFSNMASVVVGSSLQPVIGWLLDKHWLGDLDALGHRIYTADTLREALFVLPICFAIAAVFAWFVPERKPWEFHHASSDAGQNT